MQQKGAEWNSINQGIKEVKLTVLGLLKWLGKGIAGFLGLAIEGFVGICPEVIGSCHTGRGEPKIFPGLPFGVVILELRMLNPSSKLHPLQFLQHAEICHK